MVKTAELHTTQNIRKPIRFFINGEPKPWRRPTTVIKDGKRWTMQSKPDLWFAQVDQEILRNIPDEPHDGGIRITLDFRLIKPRSYSKKVIFPTKKPDLDNLAKLVIDCMTKRFFVDDSQIIDMMVSKVFDDHSGCQVEVRFL
jgi:Holliday junction resolvase RusA-like endonuclease